MLAIVFLIITVIVGSKCKILQSTGYCIISHNNNFTGELTGPIQEDDFIFDLPEGIKLGEKLTSSLKEKLGTPIQVKEFFDEGHFKTYFYQRYQLGVTIASKNKGSKGNEIISNLVITGRGFQTNRGLMIGDDKDTIIEKYGPCDLKEEFGKDVAYRYCLETILGDKSYQRYISITWSFTDYKINEISFYDSH